MSSSLVPSTSWEATLPVDLGAGEAVAAAGADEAVVVDADLLSSEEPRSLEAVAAPPAAGIGAGFLRAGKIIPSRVFFMASLSCALGPGLAELVGVAVRGCADSGTASNTLKSTLVGA